MRTELDNCGKFLSTEKFSTPFHVVTRCAQNWTFLENLVPKKSPTSSSYTPPPHSYITGSVKPKMETSKSFDMRARSGRFFWDQIFHNSPVLCASGDHVERRGKFFRSIKIFHNCPVFSPRRSASRYRLQRRVRDLSGDVVTRCAQNWTIVENFYRPKKFSTPFHVVTRCAQNWTFVENLVPKKISHFELLYPPPHSYITGSVKPKMETSKSFDMRARSGRFFWDQIFHNSPVLCASGDHVERRGKFFRSIKIFHNCPVFSPRRSASRYRLQRRVRDLSGDVVTRCAQNWTIVENFYRPKKIFHAVPRGHPMRTELDFCGKFGPKKSPTSSSYTPPHSYITGSVKPKMETSKSFDMRARSGRFFWDQIFHNSPVLCASGDHVERRGKFFRSIKIFHNCPVFSPRRSASRYRLQRRVRDLSGDVVTRCAQNWTIVENFYRPKKIFHAVPRGHPMRTELDFCGKFGPKKISHFELLYPPPHSYITGSVKPKMETSKSFDRQGYKSSKWEIFLGPNFPQKSSSVRIG